ncbi:hypothetical protein MMB232_02942 [Brevundimonas subvibrioides]|uniref:hypothetical protein n=1 Tax=Brevundimonas subvibrioides TaxID=74313 RepID=UPI0032D5A4D6
MTISEGPSEDATPTRDAFPGVFSGPLHTPAPPPSARTVTEAYQTAAWRAPAATRFDGRPANDFLVRAEAILPTRIYRAAPPPTPDAPAGWFTFLVGACVAAVMGALLGGLLSV